MDLEKELRQAMAEHAAESSAPATLVADVRRRHRRRVMRIRTTVGVAVTIVVAFAVVPTYNAFRVRVAPAGAPDSTAGSRSPAPGPGSPRAPAPGAPGTRGPAGPAGHGATAIPPGPPAGPSVAAPGGSAAPSRGGWLGYLPQGLRQTGACLEQRVAGRRTTTCRWTGSGGRVEVRLIRAPGLARPEEILPVPAVPKYTTVHGAKAITLMRPDGGAQLVWIDRPGVGVFMIVSAPLRDRLEQIAEGFRAPA